MKFSVLIVIVVLAAILSCCNNTNHTPPVVVKTQQYVREPNDSASYRHVKYNFYTDRNNRLYERKLEMANDSFSEFIAIYDPFITLYKEDTNINVPLGTIIDTSSFIDLDNTSFSKDARRVYYFNATAGGGNRIIIDGADAQTFKPLCEYRWGVDKNHIYYMTEIVKGIDLKKVQVIYSPDTSYTFVEYIKDDKQVFYNSQVIESADPKTFKVVIDKEWDAEDKNHKYAAGNRRK